MTILVHSYICGHFPYPSFCCVTRKRLSVLFHCVSDMTKEVLSSLEKLGFSSFRPGQQEAVMRILCGRCR